MEPHAKDFQALRNDPVPASMSCPFGFGAARELGILAFLRYVGVQIAHVEVGWSDSTQRPIK